MSITLLQSTKAKLNNVEAAKSVLDRYWYYFDVEVEPHEGTPAGAITISGHDSWPEAVEEVDWLEEEDYPDYYAWDDAMVELLQKQGDEGFVAMLRELAPCLETPLIIVWHRIFEGHFDGAGQWTVWPGCPHVQVHRVDPFRTT